jgi:nitric oxide dioxygenase
VKLFTHPLAETLPTDKGPAPVDARLIERLRGSLRRILEKGDAAAEVFYGLLFEHHPPLRRLFPADLTQQRAKLLATLAWVVEHLDQRDALLPAIRDLGRRHAGYGARVEHYPIVRDLLVEAMGRTAGRDWSDALAEDWRQAIDLIGRHMIAAR